MTGTSSIRIVESSADLADGFHACLDAVARERRWLLMVEAPPLEDVRTFVSKLIERGDVQTLAVDDGDVVGWCDIQRRRAPGMDHVGVLGMGLLPTHRRRGLGRRLLEACLERADAAGIARVELEVWATNVAGLRLYESSGFEHEGLRRRVRFLDDAWDDLVLMARLRDDARQTGGAGP